jgi:hypothetical protein
VVITTGNVPKALWPGLGGAAKGKRKPKKKPTTKRVPSGRSKEKNHGTERGGTS